MAGSGASGKIIIAAAIAGLGALLWFATRPQPLLVQGEVASNRYDISPRVNGRVVELKADVGDRVEKGAVLIQLDSPELRAQLALQTAALEVARANFSRIDAVRPETVAAKQADLDAAQADVVLHEQTLQRQIELRRAAANSQAQVDEARRNRDSAVKKRDSALASLKLAQEGNAPEERLYAQAQIRQAEAQIDATRTQVDELTIRAPVAGLVTTRAAELGENFGPGAPLISLVDMSDLWLTFNIREDMLDGVKLDHVYDVRIPALAGKSIKARVTAINALGQFATWRATRATGDFDLRTFEVRARPVEAVADLRPGMSAISQRAARRE